MRTVLIVITMISPNTNSHIVVLYGDGGWQPSVTDKDPKGERNASDSLKV